MEHKALTLIEAKAICKDFQHLVGKEFDKSGTVIECVIVSPLDDINKWIFSQYYLEKRNNVEALKYYSGPYYDILIIASIKAGDKTCKYKDLRSYLNENDIVFDIKSSFE
ncbi:MAG TPA: hypothetical protein VN721_00570 [Flavipsychrobacter sp.]|nr:hypothetical protein [Flavipsychrobacter sp.]